MEFVRRRLFARRSVDIHERLKASITRPACDAATRPRPLRFRGPGAFFPRFCEKLLDRSRSGEWRSQRTFSFRDRRRVARLNALAGCAHTRASFRRPDSANPKWRCNSSIRKQLHRFADPRSCGPPQANGRRTAISAEMSESPFNRAGATEGIAYRVRRPVSICCVEIDAAHADAFDRHHLPDRNLPFTRSDHVAANIIRRIEQSVPYSGQRQSTSLNHRPKQPCTTNRELTPHIGEIRSSTPSWERGR